MVAYSSEANLKAYACGMFSFEGRHTHGCEDSACCLNKHFLRCRRNLRVRETLVKTQDQSFQSRFRTGTSSRMSRTKCRGKRQYCCRHRTRSRQVKQILSTPRNMWHFQLQCSSAMLYPAEKNAVVMRNVPSQGERNSTLTQPLFCGLYVVARGDISTF